MLGAAAAYAAVGSRYGRTRRGVHLKSGGPRCHQEAVDDAQGVEEAGGLLRVHRTRPLQGGS
jgi:hypothetical protein